MWMTYFWFLVRSRLFIPFYTLLKQAFVNFLFYSYFFLLVFEPHITKIYSIFVITFFNASYAGVSRFIITIRPNLKWQRPEIWYPSLENISELFFTTPRGACFEKRGFPHIFVIAVVTFYATYLVNVFKSNLCCRKVVILFYHFSKTKINGKNVNFTSTRFCE